MRPARLQGAPKPPQRHASLHEALERAAVSGRRGLTFVAADETETTLGWDAIRARASLVAGALAALGVRPGERVAMVLPTGPEFMDAFFGTLLAGAVPVPLYPPVRLGRLPEYHAATARMLQLSGAVALLSDGRVGRLLGEAVRRGAPRLGLRNVTALRDSGAPPVTRSADPGTLALVQFSSGSTVDPKPVGLSHRAVLAQTDALRALMPDDTPEDPQLGVSWLPLYHDMGLIGCLLSAMTYPGPLVLLGPEAFLGRPALWLRALSRHQGTISVAPSFAYAVCARRVKDEEMEGMDLSRWRLALNGAEQVSVDAARRFSERFERWGFRPAALMPVYGLAEAALAVTFCPPRTPLRTVPVDPVELARAGKVRAGTRTLASVGIPVPGMTVEVRDEAGGVALEGVVGRIVARGPSIMEGYVGQPEATRAVLAGGWLDTGDLGFVQDGELVVCGRAKDVVVLRGANHAPQEFEDALDGLTGVRAGCAVA
ncbi:MAG: AMP-binding protein, partial [Myxococcaceae bacterium]